MCLPVPVPLFVAVAALLQSSACLAIDCDVLRGEVQAKIRSAGVQEFSVSIAKADAVAPGKVVGTCDQGRGKLLLQRPAIANDAAAGASPGTAKPPLPILTECRDGSVSVSGNCKP